MMGISLVILALVGIFALVVIGVLAYLFLTYNRFIGLKNGIENTFNQIRVAMKKRFDMINQLVETTSSYLKYEKDVFTDVAKLRTAPLQTPEQIKKADLAAKGLLGRLFAVMENYPNLKGMEAVKKLEDQITQVENEIARLRYLYNDQVQTYNVMTERVPSNMVASIFGFRRKEYLKFGKEIEKRPETKVY